MRKKAHIRVKAKKTRKISKKPFSEPEIIAQEPLKRITQQTCTITASVICFG